MNSDQENVLWSNKIRYSTIYYDKKMETKLVKGKYEVKQHKVRECKVRLVNYYYILFLTYRLSF